MQIDENRKLLYSDTPVPDIFIMEYLPELSDKAVKLYLYSLFLARSRKVVAESDIEARTGTDREGIRVALTELASHGLVTMTDKGFTVEDVKEIEIAKVYKPRTASQPADHQGQAGLERSRMMADISKTFFSGLMSPSWYYEIENWFDLYRFDPQVVYALFNECRRRKKLDSKAYLSKVAANWASHGVVTYEDLNRYSETYDKVTLLAKKIGQKLHKNITEYDEELINEWVSKMHYDFAIIDIALRKTSKLANPNLEYANRMLQEWFARQLTTPEAVAAYEAEKSAKYARTPRDPDTRERKGGRSSVGNFRQRSYSEDYYEAMLEDLSGFAQESGGPDREAHAGNAGDDGGMDQEGVF